MRKIEALGKIVHASVEVPGSKSISNRALILAALAKGKTRLTNLQNSDDARRMLDCLSKLGFALKHDEAAKTAEVEGRGGEVPAKEAELFVGNAGTAARFLPCLAALGRGSFRFKGDARMSERPMDEILDVLKAQGSPSDSKRYPFTLQAAGLKGGPVSIDLTRSTQFASGLLMASPYAASALKITAAGERSQIPYVDMTAAMMQSFGGLVHSGGGAFEAARKPYESPGDYLVEPDLSGACYFFAAAALLGGKAQVKGVKSSSLQGDIRFLKVLQHMGARFYDDEGGLILEIEPGKKLKAVDVDMNAFSDQALTLAALAPFCEGATTIRNVAHIRKQECDRISAISENLRALGQAVEESPDGVRITPGPLKPARIRTFGDHRVAMAFSLAGLKAGGVEIDDPACVAKTFENYWEVFDALYQDHA